MARLNALALLVGLPSRTLHELAVGDDVPAQVAREVLADRAAIDRRDTLPPLVIACEPVPGIPTTEVE